MYRETRLVPFSFDAETRKGFGSPKLYFYEVQKK